MVTTLGEKMARLGKYRILGELGKGGFATVYRALDTTLEREVALKVLDPLLMRDETWVARFHREAKAVARLRHPHIVTVFEIGEAEGRLYIAMELVEGPTLKELIATRGRLSWDETLGIMAQVAGALDYAHSQGILHRDLKPANILLDRRHGAVLTDFGFARLVGESSVSVSISGGVVGTPAYIAPEVWDGEEATPQTDLYTLGCIAFEMLTGDVLFGGNTPSVVMRKHLLDGPHFPATWPVGVPAGVTEVLQKALTKEPARRLPKAASLVEALQASVIPTPGDQTAPPEQVQRSRRGPSKATPSEASEPPMPRPEILPGDRVVPSLAGGLRRHRWRRAVASVALATVCVACLAIVGFLAVMRPDAAGPVAAPRLAPIQPGAEGLTGDLVISRSGLWPQNPGVFLVGPVRDWECEGQHCIFELDMAGTTFQVMLNREHLAGNLAGLDARQVRVYGIQPGEGELVDARLIDLGERWWVSWRPAWVTVYEHHDWNETVWLYTILDKSPYSAVGQAELPSLERGTPILLQGKWLEGGPRDNMAFAIDRAYLLEGDEYVPVGDRALPTPLPTVTLAPTSTAAPAFPGRPKPTNTRASVVRPTSTEVVGMGGPTSTVALYTSTVAPTFTATPGSETDASAPVPTQAPTPTPGLVWTCDPSKSNTEIHAEIVYPPKGFTVANGHSVQIIGSAAGHSFSRYTISISLDVCPERRVGGNSAKGCYFSLGELESRYPVVCDVLRVLDTSTWPESEQGTYWVWVDLIAIKVDSNYDERYQHFYVER